MKPNKIIIFVSLAFLIIPACKMNVKNVDVTIENPDTQAFTDAIVEINADSIKVIKGEFNPIFLNVLNSGIAIPFQIELDNSGNKMILTAVDLDPNGTLDLQLNYGIGVEKIKFKPRTYAELAMKPSFEPVNGKFPGDHFEKVFKIKVPLLHKDHDALFKYEGPGWESELVAYRLYLDQRNATDIFGKTKKGLFLEETGIHDTVAADDSYHNMQDWGMDIFKVGSSLGIGSPAMFVDNKIRMVSKTDSVTYQLVSNEPVKSEIQLNYFGWKPVNEKYDLQTNFSITAGSRLTKCDIKIDEDAPNIATGLVKHPETKFIQDNIDGWSYIAIYGKQTLNDDNLGIALLFKQDNLIELSEDNENNIVVLKPVDGKVTYYFCAAWEKEPDGIKNYDEFVKYLDDVISRLNREVKIKYN